MATRPDLSSYQTFDQVTARLDDIVAQVRDRDVSLERSLDLFDEAIALGTKAVEMVDSTALTDAEKERLAGSALAETEASAESSPAGETKGDET